MANVDIIVRMIDQTGAGVNGVKSELDGINKKAKMSSEEFTKIMGIAATVATITATVITKSYDAYSGLAEEIRDLALVSGTGAEESSRFIQVLDDYQLTAEDATLASKKLKEVGLSPTIDTLADLADKFQAIKDPAERMQFIQDNLGRGGAKWVNILSQESSKLREVSAATRESLILNDLDIKMYEVGRLAIDDKKDALEGFKVSLGQSVGNVLAFIDANARANEIMQEHTKTVRGGTVSTIAYGDALNQAIAEQLAAAEAAIGAGGAYESEADMLIRLEKEAKAAADAIAKVQKANEETINGAINLTKEHENFAEKQDEFIAKQQELQTKKSELYSWETDKIQEVEDQQAELRDEYQKTVEEFKKGMEEKFAMMAIEKIAMQDGVDGFSDAEMKKAEAVLTTMDVVSAAALSEQLAMEKLTSAVADGQISVEDFGSIIDSAMADGVVSIDEVTNALNSMPTSKVITIDTYRTEYYGSVYSPNSSGPIGSYGHAQGGTFTIPQSYGNEGFSMGGRDTASGGETLKITPKGQNDNADLLAAIKKLPSRLAQAMAQRG